MGCYDTIMVFMRCPYCKEYRTFDAQTKCLGSLMHTYDALDENWFKKSSMFGRKFRQELSVCPQFPLDKEHKVWKNQAERIEARATVHPKYKHLKFVDVICDCHSAKCKSWSAERDLRIQELVSGFGRIFHGKIKIHKGFLIGKVYDIELSDKRLPRKSKK